MLATFVLACAIIACKKTCTEGNADNSIVGKWKMTESLIDPGNGSGTWIPDGSGVTFVTFFANGTLSNNTTFLTGYDRYYTTPDSKIYVIKTSSSDTARMGYLLEPGKLTINPQCYEACGYRFVRSN